MVTKNFKEKISKVKAFAFDCDGVLTDGGVFLAENGDLLRRYSSKDRYAIVKAIAKGYPVAVISGGGGELMKKRIQQLGVTDAYLRSKNKVESMNDFCEKNGISPLDVIYVGDDIPDIKVMRMVGLCVAPSDAAFEVKAIVHHVSAYAGGYGCVRDVIEQVLKSRGDWGQE